MTESYGAQQKQRLDVAFLGGSLRSAVGRVHQVAATMDMRCNLAAGCFSRDPVSNLETGNAYGVSPDRLYSSLEALLDAEKGRIDGVVLVTPTDQHESQVLACLEAGVPVICEKALTNTSAGAYKIKAAVAETGGFLSVTYNYLGYPMLRELQALIAAGQLGSVHQVHVEMPQEGFLKVRPDNHKPIVPQDWRLHDVGVPTLSLDLGVHLHMITRFLTGEKPLEVAAINSTFGNFSPVVDNVICMAKYSNDILSNIWYGKVALGCRNGLRVRVFGERGSAEWVQETPELLHLSDDCGRRYVLDRGHPDAKVSNQPRYTRFKAGHPAGFIEAFANCYADIADSLASFRNGQTSTNPYVFGVDESLEGLLFLEAIAAAGTKGAWVRVESYTNLH